MTVSATALIKDDEGLLTPIHPADEPVDTATLTTIQSSPYSDPGHILDLSTLSNEYSQLAVAFRALEPKDKVNYATRPYPEVFNFDTVIEALRKYYPDYPGVQGVYIVAFKSAVWKETQNSSEKRQVLAEIDKASHAEANQSGGLLKYWFGTPDSNARNLATCFWRNRADARKGGHGKAHREGMKRVQGWFEEWKIEEYSLSIEPGATSYTIEPYSKI